jgi:hypothetical protein
LRHGCIPRIGYSSDVPFSSTRDVPSSIVPARMATGVYVVVCS